LKFRLRDSERSEISDVPFFRPEDLFDAGGWNTLSVKAQGTRVQIWLNGEEIGSAVVPGPEQGRLGLYLTGGESFADGELAVREVQIQELPEVESP